MARIQIETEDGVSWMHTGDIVKQLLGAERGVGLKILLWSDGSIGGIVGSGYGGELDGYNPLCIWDIDKMELEEGDEDDSNLWEKIENEIEKASEGKVRATRREVKGNKQNGK